MTAIATRPVQLVLERLDKVKPAAGGWIACCPAHDDRSPSFKVDVGRDGRALLKCHAGCSTQDILNALNLSARDLFDGDRQPGYVPPPAPMREPRAPAPAKPKVPLGRLVKTYDYTDADGALLFQVCRFDPKDFRQRQECPGGCGNPKCRGWHWHLRGIEPVLYRLPVVIEAIAREQVVFLCEGEKDADSIHEASEGRLVATTAPMGAGKDGGKWRASYSETLRGAHLCYLPDNDPAGEGQAARVATELVNVAASLRILRLPGLPLKGDVTNWLEGGNTAAELVKLTEAMRPVRPAPRWAIAERWRRAS